MKKLLIILILFSLTACNSVNLGKGKVKEWEKAGSPLKLKVEKDKILYSETIGRDKSYLYISDKKIKKEKREIDGVMVDEEYRTKNAIIYKKPKTKLLGGTEDKQEYVGVFYVGEPFYQDPETGDYYQTETAKTTLEAYEEQTATTTEVFGASGDPIYTGAGDGYVTIAAQSSWANAKAATTGSAADYTSITGGPFAAAMLVSGKYYIYRAFFPINTSAIPADSTITDATFYAYHTYVDGSEALDIVQTSQASETSLSTTDIDALSFTAGSGSGTVPVVNQYNAWTLDATGLSWIKKSGEASNCGSTAGFTCLGGISEKDTDNSAPDHRQPDDVCRFSEAPSTTQDPY
jgi:hypothetical protein